jgi:catechol 2,3-dioxygenase-like lactoylglutathione lyase family enzyme
MSMVLDHVSVQTPVVDAAVEMLRDQLGLITVRTLAAPDRHGRVYLDRGYLEVAKGTAASLALFFLRYDQFDHTRAALEGRGLRTRASLYEGIDGIWEDIEIDAGTAAPLPHLTRRTTPPEVAANWPPPLAAPQPCGAEALAAVHLRVPRLEPALEIYERLLGVPAMKLTARSAVYEMTSGRIVLQEVTELSPAIVGLELRVTALGDTQGYLSALGTKTWRADDALWVDLPGGWHLGFCEAAAGGLPSGAAHPARPVFGTAEAP